MRRNLAASGEAIRTYLSFDSAVWMTAAFTSML